MDDLRRPSTPQPLPARSEPAIAVRTPSGAKPRLGVRKAQAPRPQGGTQGQNTRQWWPALDQLPSSPCTDSSGSGATDIVDDSGPGAADIVQALEIFNLFQESRQASRTLAFPAQHQHRAAQAPRSPALPVTVTGDKGWATASFDGMDHTFAHGHGALPSRASGREHPQPPALATQHSHQAEEREAQGRLERRARPTFTIALAPREAERKANPEELMEIEGRDKRTHQDEPEALQARPARPSLDSTPRARGTIPDHQRERSLKRPKLHESLSNGGPPLEWPVAWTGVDEPPRPPQPRGPGHPDDDATR